MASDDFDARTKAFLSWLSENGISISPKMELVDLRSEGRGRGVFAVADFEEDEVIFSIPRTAAMNVKTACNGFSTRSSQNELETPAWLVNYTNVLSHTKLLTLIQALTTLMISESQREDSKWAPYLAVLPQHLDSLIFWSKSELAELQESTVTKKIGKCSAEAIFARYISPLGFKNSTTDICHRMASIIMAYAFDIPEGNPTTENTTNENGDGDRDGEDLVSDDEEDEKTTLSMIPLADMLNADGDRNNARLCCENEELEMRSIKPIVKGEEIFNDYGQLPRSDLLRRYGYVTDHYAIYDVAEISTESILSAFRNTAFFPTLPSGPLQPLSSKELERRVELAEREGVYDESYDLSHSMPDATSIPDELVGLLYIFLLEDQDLEEISTSKRVLPSRSKLETELVGQVLAALLQQREKEYPTTVEEDEKLLHAANLSYRTTMAVQVRLGEKKILREAAKEAAATFIGSNKRMRGIQEPGGNSINQSQKIKRTEEATSARKKGRFK